YWLRTGELHPEAHHIIVARLTPWISRVRRLELKSSTNCGRWCSPGSELMGILGRPRRRKHGAGDNGQTAARETVGAALLRRQLMGSDRVLARVAEEALRAEAASSGKAKNGPQEPGFVRVLTRRYVPYPRLRSRAAPRPYFGLTTGSLRTCLGGL